MAKHQSFFQIYFICISVFACMYVSVSMHAVPTACQNRPEEGIRSMWVLGIEPVPSIEEQPVLLTNAVINPSPTRLKKKNVKGHQALTKQHSGFRRLEQGDFFTICAPDTSPLRKSFVPCKLKPSRSAVSCVNIAWLFRIMLFYRSWAVQTLSSWLCCVQNKAVIQGQSVTYLRSGATEKLKLFHFWLRNWKYPKKAEIIAQWEILCLSA